MDFTGHTEYIEHLMLSIRSTYARIAYGPREWVSLTRLRDEVGGHRELVDEALRRLGREADVSIAPEENQKALSDWERQCAVRIGGQDKHLISIG